MANRVTIQIAGQRYTMLADETEEYMNEVAQLAQQTIAACGGTDAFASTRVLALSTINLADELMKTQKQLRQMQASGAAKDQPAAQQDVQSMADAPVQGKTEQVLSLLKTGPRAEPSAAQADEPVADEAEDLDFEQVQLAEAAQQAPKPTVEASHVIQSKKKHGGKPSHPAYRR